MSPLRFWMVIGLLSGTSLGWGSSGCATMGLRSAVDMHVEVAPETPLNALVYVDGRYVGSLAQVAKRGLRLVEGEHRISVEKNGYYPYDTMVVSDRQTIHITVVMLPLPD